MWVTGYAPATTLAGMLGWPCKASRMPQAAGLDLGPTADLQRPLQLTPAHSPLLQPEANVQICALVTTSAFAEYAIVPELAALKVPQGADLATSAGLPVAFGTAHVALAHRAGLQAGQTVLILGAAGGVGMAAVQVRPTRLLAPSQVHVDRSPWWPVLLCCAGVETRTLGRV